MKAKPTISDRSEFLRALKATFPQVRDAVNSWGGLLHLEVAEFSHLVQTAIDSGDRPTVLKAFQLAADHFVRGRPALQNALAVSFLEHLDFEDGRVERRWAWELMPLVLQEIYRSLRPEPPPSGIASRPKHPRKTFTPKSKGGKNA